MNFSILIAAGVLASLFITVLLLARRSIIARAVASIIALAFAAFCGFGYLASSELSAASSWHWQLSYAILGISSFATAILGLKSCFTRRHPATEKP